MPVRFKLVPAVWIAARRLRQRWSPVFALAVCLVGLPTALVSIAYAGQELDWGGLAVGTAVGAVLSGLASGASAWLALAEGEEAWAVGVEALGRALYKLSPLAGLVLLFNIPVLLLSAAGIVTQGQITGTGWDPWIWWSLSLFASVLLAVAGAVLAPVVGILMIEGGDLRPALGWALAMTRGSRPKLLALELGRLLLFQGVGFSLALLPDSWSGATRLGLAALLNALLGALMALVVNQAYAQLHANAD